MLSGNFGMLQHNRHEPQFILLYQAKALLRWKIYFSCETIKEGNIQNFIKQTVRNADGAAVRHTVGAGRGFRFIKHLGRQIQTRVTKIMVIKQAGVRQGTNRLSNIIPKMQKTDNRMWIPTIKTDTNLMLSKVRPKIRWAFTSQIKHGT